MLKKILIFTILHTASQAGFVESLTNDQLQKIEANEMIVELKEIKSLTWPEITIYKKFESNPLETVAVFYALDHQKNYIPNLIRSEVVDQSAPNKADVEYEMEMPWPISNSKYLHGHELISPSSKEYKVSWYMIRSSSADNVEGEAVFQEYKNFTILKYRSTVSPKSFFASFVKDKMLDEVKQSIYSIEKEVKRMQKMDKELLGKYVSFINNSLNGKYTYIMKNK